MIANLWMGFDDRARPNLDPESESPSIRRTVQALNHSSTPGIFKRADPAGPRDYDLWSLYYDVEGVEVLVNDEVIGYTSPELLQVRNDILDDFPGQVRTVGAWWFHTGDQVLNELGDNSLFSLHVDILEFMPDVDNGDDPPTYSPATSLTDVNVNLGQVPRKFT